MSGDPTRVKLLERREPLSLNSCLDPTRVCGEVVGREERFASMSGDPTRVKLLERREWDSNGT